MALPLPSAPIDARQYDDERGEVVSFVLFCLPFGMIEANMGFTLFVIGWIWWCHE